MKYQVLWAGSASDINRMAADLISDGFRPIGGIAMNAHGSVAQAFVKDDPPKPLGVHPVVVEYIQKGTFQGGDEDCHSAGFATGQDCIVLKSSDYIELLNAAVRASKV